MKTMLALIQRRWILIVATIGVAFLSGHLMQTGQSNKRMQPALPGKVELPKAPKFAKPLYNPQPLKDRVQKTRAVRKGGCDPNFDVTTAPDYSLHVSLFAPCHLGAPLSVRVNELMATEFTDPQGRWHVRLPFLEERMTLSVRFEDHVMTRTITSEGPPKQYVVLAWDGPETFRIRADTLEREVSERANGAQGEFVRVGSGGNAAFEIYSVPKSEQPGVIRLSVDATVTQANCGKAVSTIAYQSGYIGRIRPTEIAYTMPDCDRVGEVVRLQNLFRDMRLAAR